MSMCSLVCLCVNTYKNNSNICISWTIGVGICVYSSRKIVVHQLAEFCYVIQAIMYYTEVIVLSSVRTHFNEDFSPLFYYNSMIYTIQSQPYVQPLSYMNCWISVRCTTNFWISWIWSLVCANKFDEFPTGTQRNSSICDCEYMSSWIHCQVRSNIMLAHPAVWALSAAVGAKILV